MDFEKEFQRISNIIDNMPIEDFEKMLFECGIGVIKPSEQCYRNESIEERCDCFGLYN